MFILHSVEVKKMREDEGEEEEEEEKVLVSVCGCVDVGCVWGGGTGRKEVQLVRALQ